MTGPTTGLLLMAYGTPRSPADVEAYYTHIRRGRPPTPEQLADLRRRYDALGGVSGLAERTAEQRSGLAAALDRRAPGQFTVAIGQKHASPFVENGVEALAAAGDERIVTLVLAPHYSGFGVGEYQRRARAAAEAHGIELVAIDRWHDEPALVDFTAAAVAERLAELPARTEVVFTAHSLPERVLEGDPYPSELAASAAAVAGRVGLDHNRWSLAWQSAGRTPEPWRGPDILEVLRDRATGPDRPDGVLVCPHGFVADHLEVRYDLDIEAQAVAADVGLAFARTRVVNDDPAVLDALARRVMTAAAPAHR